MSTRSAAAAKGLVGFLRRVLGAGAPAAVLEAAGPDVALEGTPEALSALAPPILAVVGPPAPPPDHPEAHLADVDPARRRLAADALVAAEPWMKAVRCPRLLIPVGPAGLLPEAALDAKLRAAAAAERSELRRAGLDAMVSARARHAETVCRAVHALAGRLPGAKLLLLPQGGVRSFLDPQTADWILGDLKGLGLALALDTGDVWAGETFGGPSPEAWLAAASGSLGFILLADHDGRGDGALLPGAGRADFTVFRGVIGRSLPHAVRSDPRASVDDVLASATEAARRLGPVGEAH